MNEWDRELDVDPDAVRRAAAPLRSWRLLASGWDCDAWIADEAVIWRVPRRAAGIAALEHEARLMPRRAPHLPAAVPVPALVVAEGLPALARHEFIPGRELAHSPGATPAAAAALGVLLRALHDPARARELGAGLRRDPKGRADPAKRMPLTHHRLDQIANLVDVEPLRSIVDAAAGPPLATDVLCHGDLHIRHVVVDDAGALAGVIDWGDSCLGAAGVDLSVVTAFDSPARAAFFASYGPVERAAWRHARLLGVMFGALLLAADPEGAVGQAAKRWLRRLAGS